MKISKSVKKKNMEVLAKWNLKQWRYWVKMEKKWILCLSVRFFKQ